MLYFWHINEKKIFQFSLVTSLLLHTLVLLTLFFVHTHYDKKIRRKIEFVYYPEIRDINIDPSEAKMIKAARGRDWMPAPKIFDKKENFPVPTLKELSKKTVTLDMPTKMPGAIPVSSGKHQINVPFLNAEKITNPRYINYHEKIRSMIRSRAYLYVNDPDFESGEVYLTFVVKSDGSLNKVKIIDVKTNASNAIRTIGLRSIKEAGPFPAFPKDLKYPELTFNVIISFEMKEE